MCIRDRYKAVEYVCRRQILPIWEGSLEEAKSFLNEMNSKDKHVELHEEGGGTKLSYLDLSNNLKL